SNKRSSRTCRSAPPRCCATTSRRRDPCGSRRWRRRRRKSSRPRASSRRRARSRSAARARNMSEASRLRAIAAAAAAAAERWSLPTVDGPIVGGSRREMDPAKAARALEGERSRGYEAGLAAARAEIERLRADLQTRAQRLDSLLALLTQPLAALDDEVQRQLALLALAIGKQLARRELKASPEEVIPLIRDCVGRLPAAARDVRVHLHPDDAALVREHLAAPAGERAWTLIED